MPNTKTNSMQIFRCRVTHVKGRNSIYINFRAKFWEKVKPSQQKTSFSPQFFINRVYFFEQDQKLFISFKDPIHMPMYRMYVRRLQYAGQDYNSYKVTIPIQLVRKYDLRQYNIIKLHRMKNQSGLVHSCTFTYDKKYEKIPITKQYSNGIYVPLIDLLR